MACRCPSSYNWISYIWAFLSIIAAIICPFGLYFSNWLERQKSNGFWDSVSSFRVCLNESSRISGSCSSYLMFNQIYSVEWQVVTLMMGGGACLLVLVALTSLFGFCVVKLFNIVVTVLTFIFQLVGVVLFAVSLVIFPAGLNAQPIKVLCGDGADRFKLGNCSIGWAYILIVVGTAIAAVAVVLSWSTCRWREKDRNDHLSYSA